MLLLQAPQPPLGSLRVRNRREGFSNHLKTHMRPSIIYLSAHSHHTDGPAEGCPWGFAFLTCGCGGQDGRMWAGRVRQVSPGTAGERESRKGRLDPFPVVADVLTEVFRPQLCETLKAPLGPCRLRARRSALSCLPKSWNPCQHPP